MDFLIAPFISSSYPRFGVRNIVFLISLDSINFLIAVSWDNAFIPTLTTLFGSFNVLFVRDKKVISLIKKFNGKEFKSSTLGGCIFMRKMDQIFLKKEENWEKFLRIDKFCLIYNQFCY